jgi:hypothetical protein
LKWRQIILSEPTSITFDDGVEAFISCNSKVIEGKRQGDAKLISAAGKQTNLFDAVDDGQTTSAPNIFAIAGERPQEVFLFGGPMAYRLDSALTIQEQLKLYRKREYEEFWTSNFVETKLGLAIIYEGGILFLNKELLVKWHIKKYFNDFFESLEGDRLYFRRDHKEEWSLSVSSGTVLNKPL